MKIEISDKLVADYKQLHAVRLELHRVVAAHKGSHTPQHYANCDAYSKAYSAMSALQVEIERAMTRAFREAVGDGSLK